jgi:hypothetical protein
MSILAQLHVGTGVWQIAAEPESPSPVVEIGFVGDETPVRFDGLTFGFACDVDGGETIVRTYPPEGVSYVQTDQAYISTDMLLLEPGDEATLLVWAENAGERYEETVSFSVPELLVEES